VRVEWSLNPSLSFESDKTVVDLVKDEARS
jgi:hypothetical protein